MGFLKQNPWGHALLNDCSLFPTLLLLPSLSLQLGFHILCKGSGADSWWSFLHKLSVSESLTFVPGMLLPFFFFCFKMVFSKCLLLILLSCGWLLMKNYWIPRRFLCLLMNHTHRCFQFCVPFCLSTCIWFWEDKTLSEEQAPGLIRLRIIYVFLMAFL